MSIVRLYDPSNPYRGLWLHGTHDQIPKGGFRRLIGTERNPRGSLKTRTGSTNISSPGAAHSLVRFDGDRYVGVTGSFDLIGTGTIKTGLSGSRLRFGKAPPTPGQLPYLFVANGGAPFKVNGTGGVSNWGIAPPADGSIAVAAAAEKKTQIDSMDATTGWTATVVTMATEATIKQEGSNSLKITVPTSSTGTITKSITQDLTVHTGPLTSADEDFIMLWVRVDNPENLQSLSISFSLNNTTFADNTYSYIIPVTLDSSGTDTLTLTKSDIGLGKLTTSPDGETVFVTPREDATSDTIVLPLSSGEIKSMLKKMGQVSITTVHGVWTRVKIPKTNFGRSGTGAYTWADVDAVRISFTSNDQGPAVVYVDDLALLGDVGLQGTYKYHFTFYNSSTGTRSAPNATALEVGPLTRQRVNITGLPGTCSDAQVDQIEVWRTVGDGTFFFKVAGVAIASTSASDITADAYFMDTRSGAAILSDTELPLTNAKPAATTSDVTPAPVDGVTWTLDSAAANASRAYYSAPGYPEGVAGFVEVTEPDDPLQRYAVWNGLYVFSKSGLFRIIGTYPAYVPERVVGVPGTIYPDTVQVTPYGIAYCSYDGPRLFDGARSERIGEDSVNGVFEGGVYGAYTTFIPTHATYAREEYYISGANATFAYDLARGAVVRDPGLLFTASHYEAENKTLLVCASSTVMTFEDIGVVGDAGVDQLYDVEVALALTDSDTPGFVRRLYIDINANDEDVGVQLILDSATPASYAIINATTRQVVEVPIHKSVRMFGVRLVTTRANDTAIELYGIWADVYIPGNDPP